MMSSRVDASKRVTEHRIPTVRDRQRRYACALVWTLFNSDRIMAHGAPRDVTVESMRRRKQDGCVLLLWSKLGESVAKERAEKYQLLDLFDWAQDHLQAFADEPGLSQSGYVELVTSGRAGRAVREPEDPWA